MKAGLKSRQRENFIAPARRALRRAARKVEAENRRFGLPVIISQLTKVPAARS